MQPFPITLFPPTLKEVYCHRMTSPLALAFAIAASRIRNWIGVFCRRCGFCCGSGGGGPRAPPGFPTGVVFWCGLAFVLSSNFPTEVVFFCGFALALTVASACFHTFAVLRSCLGMMKHTFSGTETLRLSRLGDGPFDSFPRLRDANSSVNPKHPLSAACLVS